MLNLFHFLRPWWFIALVPALFLFLFMQKRAKSANHSNWSAHCDPHLLQHLLQGQQQNKAINYFPSILLISWIIAILALAGPTWSLYAQPVYQKNIARVIVLDLSQSMNNNDLAPSRLSRAKYKILDLLHQTKEGQTGMIVFSKRAFVVSPLTNDSNTIASLVSSLDSNIMPVQGSDIRQALLKAENLLKQAGSINGEIILVTDSSPSTSAIEYAHKLAKEGYQLSVLAIASNHPAPLVDDKGNFQTDKNGNAILATLDSRGLKNLAHAGNGTYVLFSGNTDDITQLIENNHFNQLSNKPTQETQTKNLWKDQGHWLIWLLVLISACFARKGWLEKLC